LERGQGDIFGKGTGRQIREAESKARLAVEKRKEEEKR